MEKEIKEYQALKAPSTEQLSEWVSQAIKNGWQPFGGVAASSVTADENGKPSNLVIVVQAMVKY